jgi:hypothetical protein
MNPKTRKFKNKHIKKDVNKFVFLHNPFIATPMEVQISVGWLLIYLVTI